MNIQNKPEPNISFSDLPPGSYVVKDGKLLPNPNDEAMVERLKVKGQKSNEKSESVSHLPSDVLPARDADVSDS